jgi:hypothetical protein
MQEGAFALVDCLGFKGAWKKTDPNLLIQKFSAIDKTVSEHVFSDVLALRYLSFGPIRAHVRLLSDTVAISLQYDRQEGKDPEKWQRNILVPLICDSVLKVLNLFLEGEPPFVLRGCITYGEHVSEGNVIVGPAVDDAAEQMSISEGAFVWLHPSAAFRLRKFQARVVALLALGKPEYFALGIEKMSDPEGKFDWARKAIKEHGPEVFGKTLVEVIQPFAMSPVVIDPYPMPLKQGARLECPVINPLAFHRTPDKRASVMEAYAKIISGNRLDIWLKHQHTMRFLEEAQRISAKFEDEIAHLRRFDQEEEQENVKEGRKTNADSD